MHRVVDRLEINESGQAVIYASQIGLTFWTKDFVVVGDSAVVSWDVLIVSLSEAGFAPAKWHQINAN